MPAKQDAYSLPSKSVLWTILIIYSLIYEIGDISEREHTTAKRKNPCTCLSMSWSGGSGRKDQSTGLIVRYQLGSLTIADKQRRQYP